MSDPIQGRITDQAGSRQAFSGWTGLLAALDAAIDTARTGGVVESSADLRDQ